ncbi:MAG: hypothetical protein H7Y01_11405, partial [Ferruginibacter sp.]|nr:hypothetical protein [Chitinophagaceae bacterium]
EAGLLQEYLWLEHTRFPDKFEYEINLPGNLEQAGILPLLTHGLVEQALYRGVLNLDNGKKGKILIDFEAAGDMIVVQVTDNGMSREQSGELEKRKGIAKKDDDMLARRIRLFNRQGKRKITLHTAMVTLNKAEPANRARLEIPQPLFDTPIL